MNYLEKVKSEHITNCPKVLAIIQEMQDKIDSQARTISQWEQPVQPIEIDDLPNILRKQAGSEIDLNNKRSD